MKMLSRPEPMGAANYKVQNIILIHSHSSVNAISPYENTNITIIPLFFLGGGKLSKQL